MSNSSLGNGRDKPMRILNERPFSWKERIAVFTGVFGGTWLFLEPLSAFSIGTSTMAQLGIAGYIGLILLSGIMALLCEWYRMKRIMGKKTLIQLTLILTESGTRLEVETPQDMRIGHFVNLGLDYLERMGVSDSFLKSPKRQLYNWFLYAQRNGRFVKLPNNKTFDEGGLINGTICKFQGEIKKEFIKAAMAAKRDVESQVVLSWQTEPQDLDLHLFILNPETLHHIFYRNRCSPNSEAWVELGDDVQHGHGPETIRIVHWLPAKYICVVHNYSRNPPLAGSGATVTFQYWGNLETFLCPTVGQGTWWIVFTYQSEYGQLEEINQIVEETQLQQFITG